MVSEQVNIITGLLFLEKSKIIDFLNFILATMQITIIKCTYILCSECT